MRAALKTVRLALASAAVPGPVVVLVSGPPCAGKTTVATALSGRMLLPLLSMDFVKSSIVFGMAARGPEGVPVESRDAVARRGGPAGQRAFAATYDLMGRCLAAGVSVIVEKAWQRGRSEPELLAVLGDAHAVQIHLSVPLHVAVQRGRARPRRPGLVDMDEVELQLQEGSLTWESFGPLALDIPLHTVSTGPDTAIDIAALERFVWRATA